MTTLIEFRPRRNAATAACAPLDTPARPAEQIATDGAEIILMSLKARRPAARQRTPRHAKTEQSPLQALAESLEALRHFLTLAPA